MQGLGTQLLTFRSLWGARRKRSSSGIVRFRKYAQE